MGGDDPGASTRSCSATKLVEPSLRATQARLARRLGVPAGRQLEDPLEQSQRGLRIDLGQEARGSEDRATRQEPLTGVVRRRRVRRRFERRRRVR